MLLVPEAGLGQSNKGHCDVPRFEALVRDNTSTPADLTIMEDHTTMVLLELCWWSNALCLTRTELCELDPTSNDQPPSGEEALVPL